jgi:carbon storage regulator CsrA
MMTPVIKRRHKQQSVPHGQLVLSRRTGQSIVLRCPDTGVKIVVTVAEVRNGKVRLATNAPKAFMVNRCEVDREVHPDDYERG